VGTVRLDTWLDVACLFKTRSEATKACRLNKVIVNGTAAKPHRDVKIGDQLEIQDRTPKPTPEEIEVRRLERIYRAAATPPTRPDRDQRRTLRRLKRGE
jgi:ribosome-associated heat shock protein Hsp15